MKFLRHDFKKLVLISAIILALIAVLLAPLSSSAGSNTVDLGPGMELRVISCPIGRHTGWDGGKRYIIQPEGHLGI